MINFRKLKQDFASSIVKEGRQLYEQQKVVSAKLLHLDAKTFRIAAKVQGQFDNCYESQIEVDRLECETIDSDCDCPYNHDCHHLAAVLFYLEEHFDKILVAFSKGIESDSIVDQQTKAALLEKIKEAESKEVQRREEHYQKEVLEEYVIASQQLASSPFFKPRVPQEIDQAEFALIFNPHSDGDDKGGVEIQIALRLVSRSKPLYIPHLKLFAEAIRHEEPLLIGGKKYHFSLRSFQSSQQEIVRMVLDRARFAESSVSEKTQRIALLDWEVFGMVLSHLYDNALQAHYRQGFLAQDDDSLILPGLYEGSLETALRFFPSPARLRFSFEYMQPPTSKILIIPQVLIGEETVSIDDVRFLESARTGFLRKGVYYRFSEEITRTHVRNLRPIRDMTIPEPLFGTLVENALPELSAYAEMPRLEALEQFITLPSPGGVAAVCDLSYLDGELDAKMYFVYEGNKIPSHPQKLSYDLASAFITQQGILARNLVEERQILEDVFPDFLFNLDTGAYVCKWEKKIVEFMTDIIPRNQQRVTFNCPQNLLDQFIYDQTTFSIALKDMGRIDLYQIELEVKGPLSGIPLDQLWECMSSKRPFIELSPAKGRNKKEGDGGKMPKILVLNLDRIRGVIQLFDEIGIEILENSHIQRPLWSLANIDAAQFEDLPVTFSITDRLIDIRKQMLGETPLAFSAVPSEIQATLRPYQQEGVRWLERLRMMFLSGILADDMGLGKTLQAIVAITQYGKHTSNPVLIVCPTSLLYNWKEEICRFHPSLKSLVIDGTPAARKKWIDQLTSYDIIITSYTLLQKDIESYRVHLFAYVVLDEAQHIKNRGTRNAKSVKLIAAEHRLILSGTPIENSLDELWSLFDFLMPGFLGTYEKFIEKYIRMDTKEHTKNLEYLRKKVSPFILRRMKADVLDDLPPVSELIYHCQLTETQEKLYRTYAEAARSELVKLVEKEGFDRVQIHVLATLTRLKQICCHPAIFAKEKAEPTDSAKYEMLLELLQTLMEGGHKTVIFSQYTRMLQIMSEDFKAKGIRFSYLDGSTSSRLEVVKEFNEDPAIPVFLVSLKAGGTGLNLVGADTVIHYDMWWNPAVESQATDRVHRMGQKNSVSAYKLITLNTIEEKIAEMQKKKKGLVKKVVSCDDEAIAKLTWEDVLELLKT